MLAIDASRRPSPSRASRSGKPGHGRGRTPRSKRTAIGRFARSVAAVLAIAAAACGPAAEAAAQCLPLSPRACDYATGVPRDYSFYQSLPYWTAVGVAPQPGDDKDIGLYTGCPATGSLLASSTGVNGMDIIVGDFNHNAYGTFYPRVGYGNAGAQYITFWTAGGTVFPVSLGRLADLGSGPTTYCDQMEIYDVYLEAGVTYEFRFTEPNAFAAHLALFRNPGTGTYWAGRSASEFELTGHFIDYTYVAPATDWYGLVVFADWKVTSRDTYSIDVEKLDDCMPLTSAQCVSNVLYTPGTGPRDNYSFTQTSTYWAAVAVASAEGTHTSLHLYTGCDENGSFLTSTGGLFGDTGVIVGDFNHNPLGTYFPVLNGMENSWHTIEWAGGTEVLTMNGGAVTGEVGGTTGECRLVSIWDVGMEQNKSYGFSFEETGAADIRVALFRNPGTGTYWAPNGYDEWTLDAPTPRKTYTAPQTDWYGFAVWTNEREASGSYSVAVEELADCYLLTSGVCVSRIADPGDFSFTGSGYWTVVGVQPSVGDDKDISVYTACDGDGTQLAHSSGAVGADFVVADFNHIPDAMNYARVTFGDPSSDYTVQHDGGMDMFPHDVIVEGEIGGTDGSDCSQFKIWDVFLEQGHAYEFGFTRGGPANVRLALFRNPGNGAFWGDRAASEWELGDSGNHAYTAPATDWYGLVVFGNRRGSSGTYTIRVSDAINTAIEQDAVAPERFELLQNTPNPFNPTTAVRYTVPAGGGRVSIRIYDVSGRLVRTLVDADHEAGEKSAAWDGRNENGDPVSSGVYLCRMETAGFSQVRKMVLMK